MTEPEPPAPFAQSLCWRCREVRKIVSGRGSIFLMCQRGLTEASWPKYPAQPVRNCRHFQAAAIPTTTHGTETLETVPNPTIGHPPGVPEEPAARERPTA
jgi:hypothetical protein